MKKISWVVLLLVGCTEPLTNEQIIAETMKCRSFGMDAVQLSNWASGDMVFRVECRSKKEHEVGEL